MKSSLHHIADYIKNRHLKNNREEDIPSLLGFRQAVWTLISAIYGSSWDALKMDDSRKSFYNKVSKQFSKKIIVNTSNKKSKKIPTSKLIHKTINDTGKLKPHINMTTKSPSYKQIIVPIGSDNIKKIVIINIS